MAALIGTPALAADMPLKAPSSDQAPDSQQQSKPSAEDPDYNGEDFTLAAAERRHATPLPNVGDDQPNGPRDLVTKGQLEAPT